MRDIDEKYREEERQRSSDRILRQQEKIESLQSEIAQLKQPQWVSVDTEPKDGEYLCLVDDIVTSWQEVLSYKRRTKTWHCNYVNGAYPPRVSAYMPLPTPPVGDSND